MDQRAHSNARRVQIRLEAKLSSKDWKVFIDESGWRVQVRYLGKLERRNGGEQMDHDATAYVGLDVECRIWSSYLPNGGSSAGNHRPSCNRRYEGRWWPERMAEEFVEDLHRTVKGA